MHYQSQLFILSGVKLKHIIMKYNAFFILFLFLMSCTQEKTQEANQETPREQTDDELHLSDTQLKALDIQYTQISKEQTAGSLQLNGKITIDPNYKVSVSSALGGRIQNINCLPGKYVKKGETLFTLEDNQIIQIQQDYLTTKAQLLSAEPNYLRQKELNSNQAVSDKVLQQAEAEYHALLATKSGLEQKLQLIHLNPETLSPQTIQRVVPIPAPFNAWVSDVFVNKGKYVTPSDVLAELINPQGLLINVRAFEKDLAQIRVGQAMQAYTNSDPEVKIEAKVLSKGNHIHEDGTAEIIAQVIDSKSVELVEGLYVNARIHLDNMEVFTLPNEAIVSYEDKHYVFEQIDSNTFRMKTIQLGTQNTGTTSIMGAEKLENKVLVGQGAYSLLMALKNKAEE